MSCFLHQKFLSDRLRFFSFQVIRQKLVINPPGCDDEDVRFPVVRQRLRDCKSTTAAAVNTQSGNTMDNHRNRDSAETEVQVGSPDLQVRVTVIGHSLHKDDDIGAVSIFNLNADLAKDPTEVPEDEIKKDGLALGVWRKAVRSASV